MRCIGAAGFLVLLSGAAGAHHSISAMYAREMPVTVTGSVAAFEFRNPHPVIHLDVVAADGATERWVVEWSNRTRLAGQGVTAETLKTGDRIVVTGGPARDGSKGLFVARLQRPADGYEYVSRAQ